MAWAAPAVVCPFISVTLGVGKFGPACHWAATDRIGVVRAKSISAPRV